MEIAGADVVVVGRGVTVGRPLGLLLTRRSENATVTLCHTGTRDLAAHVRQADIVVAAAGVPGIITGDMVKPGAAVLDVGVSRVDGKLAGDVAADVWDVAGWVSPNPGGVGPMTRAMLLSNIVAMRRGSAPSHGRDAGAGACRARGAVEHPRSRRAARYPSTVGGAFYLVVLAVTAASASRSSPVGDWRLGVARGRRVGLLVAAALLRAGAPASATPGCSARPPPQAGRRAPMLGGARRRR